MTIATSVPLKNMGLNAGARTSRAGLAALVLCLAATTAHALTPLPPECYPHQEGIHTDWPADLGSGMVSRAESFQQADDSWRLWTIITECSSGRSIAVAVEDYEQNEAVNALVRSAIQSPEIIGLGELARRLDRAFGEAFIDQSRPATVETCPCNLFYPNLQGNKIPYGS